jgi:UDP-N-acetylglucosamine--N-acetylmuramyl-(pentapeptide) pyrophosphoryl-undecaprenol N-acetylglucosamine transferase
VYAASDLVIARGGASTVIELAVTGTPSVLVPWGGAADDHQRANVAWLVEAGAAVTLDDVELHRLGDVVDSLRGQPDHLAAMAQAARDAGAVHRSGSIVAVIDEVAG